MLKKTNLIFALLLMVMCLITGLMFLNRATKSKTDLNIIDGKVICKNKKYSTSIKGGKFYYLEFELENNPEKLAIGYISESQANNDLTFDKIEIGRNYKFFIDKSFPNSDGTNYGIDYIENNNKIVFSKNHKTELFFSALLILTSGISIFFVIKKLNKTTTKSAFKK